MAKGSRQKTAGESEGPGPARRSTRVRKERACLNPDSEFEDEDSDDDFVEPAPKKAAPKKKTAQAKKGTTSKEIERRNTLVVSQDSETEGPEKIEGNVLTFLDRLVYGRNADKGLCMKSIRNTVAKRSISKLTTTNYAGQFIRRITSLAWHEKFPYSLASASKFGDIMFLSGVPNDESSSIDSPIKFLTKAELKGGGPGYSITAMKFHERDLNILYRSSIDCTVARVDLAHQQTRVYHDTRDYNNWFCSLDVNFPRNILIAGDNKGKALQFDLNGKLANTWRLHKNKIHHFEFSKKDPNLLVSSSLDKKKGVCIWDIRSMRKKESGKELLLDPLHTLEHNAGLNLARFSPLDGSRLLTSDQLDEIRVYQGPLWSDYITIKHHHKQFQHITPIKADWHPVNDYIVIGRYPRNENIGSTVNATKLVRAIDFFDSYTGKFVDAIYPPMDEICSLNVFNPTGEYLATGMNSKLILWKPDIVTGVSFDLSDKSDTNQPRQGKVFISEQTRDILRGRARRTRELSPVSDSEGGEEKPSKRKRPMLSRTRTTEDNDTTSKSGSTKNSKNRKTK